MRLIHDKWCICELKVKCLRLITFLETDDVYTKKSAAKELRVMLKMLDQFEDSYNTLDITDTTN